MEHQIIDIASYKDSDRCTALKSAVWNQASTGKPFGIDAETGNEYMYFHKLYELYKLVVNKSISQEEAADQDRKNYMKFELDEHIRENYLFDHIEWQQNVIDSESLRCSLVRAKSKDEIIDILSEIAQKLTKDTTIVPTVKKIIEEIYT